MPSDYENPYTSPQADLTLPEQPQDKRLQLASRGARFAASLIDGIITFVIAAGVFLVLGLLGPEQFMEEFSSEDSGTGAFTIIGFIISWGLVVALNFHFWNMNGQSIGKVALKIKIVRTDGSKASLFRIIFLRLIIMSAISTFGSIGSIIYLVSVLLIFRRERNCLHDDIADTRVIYAK